MQTRASRAANDTSLVALAVLLEAHGLAASTAHLVRDSRFTTAIGGLELGVECVRVSLHDVADGLLSQFLMSFVVGARVTIALLGARHTRRKALAVPCLAKRERERE